MNIILSLIALIVSLGFTPTSKAEGIPKNCAPLIKQLKKYADKDFAYKRQDLKDYLEFFYSKKKVLVSLGYDESCSLVSVNGFRTLSQCIEKRDGLLRMVYPDDKENMQLVQEQKDLDKKASAEADEICTLIREEKLLPFVPENKSSHEVLDGDGQAAPR